MGSLSNLYISQSYQSLIHLGTNNTASANLIELQDGLGNSIGVAVDTAGNLYISGTLSASLQEGYLYVGDSSGRTIAVATSSIATAIDTGSLVTTSSFNAYTQSNNLKWQDLGNKSGSWITESETGSFARYDVSNPWSADQNFTNISAVSASFTYIKTIFETASVIYSSGSNQFGDELTDIQTLSGSVKIRGGLLVNDLDITGSINSISAKTGSYATTGSNSFNGNQTITGSLIVSQSAGTLSSNMQSMDLRFNGNRIGNFETPPRLSFTSNGDMHFNVGADFKVFSQDLQLNGSDTFFRMDNSQAGSVPIAMRSMRPGLLSFQQAGFGFVNLNTNGVVGQIGLLGSIFSGSQGHSFTGSLGVSGNLNVVGSLTASLQQGYAWVGNSSGISTAVPTSSFGGGSPIDTASFVTTASFNTFTQSYLNDSASFDSRIDALESFSSSLDVTFVNQNELAAATGALENSIATKLDTASFNSYTQSNDTKWNDLQTFTASITASVQELLNFSSSLSGGFVTEGELQAATASLINQINTKLDTASFNSYTQSNDSIVNSLVAATSSYVTETESGSFLITASFNNGNRNLTFTKGDTTTFDINIPAASVDTGSFATTGSNSFQGNQEITGALSITNNVYVGADIQAGIITATSQVQTDQITDINGDLELRPQDDLLLNPIGYIEINRPVKWQDLPDGYLPVGGFGDEVFFVPTASFTNTASFEAYTGSNDLKWTDLGSKSGSWVTESETGSFLITSSFDNTTRNLRFNRADGTFYDIGGFATTGSNVFRGTETFEDAAGNWSSLHPISGGFYLIARGFTSASAHISSSNASLAAANGLTNIVFKSNNNTADTILSGSSNIFTNPGAPTAGFKRYLTAGNLSLMGGLPQISGSMAFSPTITSNILAYSLATANPMTIRGPVSSSAYSISTNLLLGAGLNLGTSAANNFQQAVNGVSIANNIIGGSFGLVANRTRLTQTINIGGNQVQGANTFNMNSSSIDLSTSLLYGTNIINNNSTGSSRVSAAGNAVGIYQSSFFGTNTATFSGSNDPNDVQDLDYQGGIYRSLIVGTNTPFVITGPTGSNSINNTGIIGNGLIVTGSSGNQNFGNDTLRHGSLFAGRWNADGTRNRTSENVFAIGTGTSNTARKTGFLIDSGSNTYVEGTLNVSGSTSMTGSLTIQSGSGDLFVHGHKQFNCGAFQSNVTQSGSANVSQSVQFDTTDVSYGVTLSDGSRLNVQNAGVYLITFSAQVLADSGADTIYLWIKKNGTNVAESATKLTLENNDAEVATVTFVNEVAANDYYEIAWQTTQGDAVLYSEAASGNIPAIPSVIATITQVR